MMCMKQTVSAFDISSDNVLHPMYAQEDEGLLLLRRLDALERLVFGRAAAAAPVREAEPLAAKVEALSKSVARAEGGRDLRDLAAQGVTQCEIVADAQPSDVR